MKRLPIGELLLPKPRPATTLSLEPSLQDSAEMVESYVFTETIRHYMVRILDTVARGVGQGFWVQAEYGAGKTHFLAVLAALLSDTSEELWSRIGDDEVRQYRRRLENLRLLPVVLSLRGESSPDGLMERSLLDVVVERGLRPALARAGLGSVLLTPADDILHWLETSPSDALRADIESFIARETGSSLATYRATEGNEAAARLVMAYCDRHAITPTVAAGLRSRLLHIYRQVTAAANGRYNGILFVIDEYEGWERSRTHGQGLSQDAEFLETLGYLLPREHGLQLHTVVASQSSMPAKLVGGQEGDRFINLPLLAERNARDYDIIISRRVRGLRRERLPEINDHFMYCQSMFAFAHALTESEFADVFPFQPRCFEVVRRITARDLPTARSGILIFHEVVNHPELLAGNRLIRVCDLLRSSHLVHDCLTAPAYKEAFAAYRSVSDALPTLAELDPEDLPLARDVLATLFLWHLAYVETPRPMSISDLAECTLTTDDVLKAEDSVRLVLQQMKALPQIEFDGKAARFVPKGSDGLAILTIFNEYLKRAYADRYRVLAQWRDSLFLMAQETGGLPGLFADFRPDQPERRQFAIRNLEYAGHIVVATRWQLDWQLPLPKEDVHFRLIILPPDAPLSFKPSDLQDPRIAIVCPGALDEEAFRAAATWLAWQDMSQDYRGRTDREAEAVREWLDRQRQSYLTALVQTHLDAYRKGTIITRNEVAISPREVFSLPSNQQRFTVILEKLLAAAYDDPIVDAGSFRGTFTTTEAAKLLEGYFGTSPGTTQLAATRNYGVPLGLSHPEQPQRFAPQPGCRPLEIIAEMIEKHGGRELPVSKVFERLSGPPYGLPYLLIRIYLLAFVRRGDPRAEIVLRPDHNIRGRGGRPFLPDRITAQNATDVDWRGSIERGLDTIVLSEGPTWNDVLGYARELVPDLHASTDQADIDDQAARLRDRLSSLAKEMDQTKETLKTLERSLGGDLPEADQRAWAHLRSLVAGAGDDYAGFYNRACLEFAAPDDLHDALASYERLRQLASVTAQINEVKAYLDACTLPPEHRELLADRDSLRRQLSLESLAAQPARWTSLRASFEQFRVRYRNEYQKYHRDANEALARLASRMEDARRQLRALALLNSVNELGPARGEGLSEQYERLAPRVRPCQVQDFRLLSLDSSPACDKCKRTLADEIPDKEVEAFLDQLKAALAEQSRRLSSEAVRRVLARSGHDAVSQFLAAARAADITSLVEILDDELVHTIRRLLAADGVATEEVDILSRLVREYPTIEESQIPAIVRRFEEALREAFARARKAHPQKRSIRLSLR